MASPLRFTDGHVRRGIPERSTRRAYERLLSTATDAEHRTALRLLPLFPHFSIREAYVAAMAVVRSGLSS
jgi:hypothetical protein